jgi:hypothetical protein
MLITAWAPQATQLVVKDTQTGTIWRGTPHQNARQAELRYPALALASLTSTKGAPQEQV